MFHLILRIEWHDVISKKYVKNPADVVLIAAYFVLLAFFPTLFSFLHKIYCLLSK
jgi:hypothetical protein